MRGVSSHEPDKIPIFSVGRGIDHEVGNESRVSMGAGGESYTSFEFLVRYVVINRSRNADDFCVGIMLNEVIC